MQIDQEVRLKPDSTTVGRACIFVVSGFSRTGMLLVTLFTCACRQDMHDQPKYEPLEETTFYGDTMSARPRVPGTVARGHLNDDEHLYAGKIGKTLAATFPYEVTGDVLRRGRERYNIFCSPCHGRTGDGDGMIVRRGYRVPPSLHDERLRAAPVGHFFDVMTNGFGAMPEYAPLIPAHDRWAIIAYVRALQLSRHATIGDVPEDERKRLEQVRLKPDSTTDTARLKP